MCIRDSQVTRYSLSPEVVDLLAFCTKIEKIFVYNWRYENISFKESAKEQDETSYEWYVENNPQEGDLVGAIYEGIAEFLNGLDDAERAEVLYDVYAANVYQNGNGEDEQGRVLHTMFDQVIIENVSFK